MPVYVHKCKKCEKVKEVVRKVADYKRNFPTCCGEEMPMVLCAPAVFDDMTPYRSPVDGSIINSRSDHRNHLKEHKLIEVGNEKLKPRANKPCEPEGIAKDIVRAINQ
jgi:hypothetical protein